MKAAWLVLLLVTFGVGCEASPAPTLPPAVRTNEPSVEEAQTLETTSASRLAPRLGLVDLRRGVTMVTAGPTYSPVDMATTDVHRAEHLCGDAAVRAARQAMQTIVETSEATCDALRCTKPARSEWDSAMDVRFFRDVDGTMRIESIVVVLDVPMRPGAESDFAWAEKRRAEVVTQTCAVR